MNPHLSVNEVIDQLHLLNGKSVGVEGVLEFEFEHCAITHLPKNERKEPLASVHWVYGSSLWLTTGNGALKLNTDVLQKWSGHRVRVLGVIHTAGPLGGCGHMSAWPAEIEAVSIERV